MTGEINTVDMDTGDVHINTTEIDQLGMQTDTGPSLENSLDGDQHLTNEIPTDAVQIFLKSKNEAEAGLDSDGLSPVDKLFQGQTNTNSSSSGGRANESSKRSPESDPSSQKSNKTVKEFERTTQVVFLE
jgi:hypothetical protein